jgi:alkylated DNA repair dioxygenase AlkB
MDLFGTYKTNKDVNTEIIKDIPGLNLLYDFVSTKEELKLIEAIDNSPWLDDLKRKVQHYGFKYDYKLRRIDESLRIGDLPIWCNDVTKKFLEVVNIFDSVDQLIINNYEPGQGIAMHTDCEPCFTNTIVSLSLGADIVMDFSYKGEKEKISIILPRRSLLLIQDDARYNFLHGIAQRKKDKFNEKIIERKRRVSMTFRKVIIDK